MFTLQSIQLFALNVAIVSSLCFTIAIGVSKLFVSLPKRYATLAVGLAAGVLAPLMVALGTWCSLGVLPSMPSTSVASMRPSVDMNSPTKAQLPRPIEIEPPLFNAPHAPAMASPADTSKLVVNEQPNGAIGNDTSSATPWPINIGTALLALWAIGSLALLFGRFRKLMLCRKILMNCHPVQDSAVRTLLERVKERLGISSNVLLLESESFPTPVVFGWWKPCLILPTELQFSLTASQLASILTHELSHIARNDHRIALLQSFADIFYWWNPLNRFSSRHMNGLREMICDDIAKVNVQAPREYAETIVQMAARSVATHGLAGSLGIGLSPAGELERRLKRIIAGQASYVDVSLSKRFTTALLAMSVLFVGGLLFAQVPPANESKGSVAAAQPLNANAAQPANSETTPTAPAAKPSVVSGKVVDTEGKPIASAVVCLLNSQLKQDMKTTTDADGNYRFELPVPTLGLWPLFMSAESADHSQKAYLRFPFDGKPTDLGSVQIKVEPVQAAKVKVVDASGQPIPDANAALVLPMFLTVDLQRTDANGIATFQVPRSEKIEGVYAWKDGSGLDYKNYTVPAERKSDLNAQVPEFPTTTPEVLKLDGSTPFTIRVLNDAKQPIADAKVDIILKGKDADDFRNPGWFFAKTDSNGIATFNWFPTWHRKSVVAFVLANGFVNSTLACSADGTAAQRELSLQRATSIRGRVTFPDGSSAPAVSVSARGVDDKKPFVGAGCISGPDGSFNMEVAPDRTYRIFVNGRQWAADSYKEVFVESEKPREDLDFRLYPLTRIHGKVVDESTGKAVPNFHLILQPDVYHKSLTLKDREELIQANSERQGSNSNLHTDESGEYECYASDGDYVMFLMGTNLEPERLTIQGEDDKEVNYTLNPAKEFELTGRVVSNDTRKPLSGIIVSGHSCNNMIEDQWQAVTDSNGEFKVRRKGVLSAVSAISEDKVLGAIKMLGVDQADVELRLSQAGSATGRLMNEDGRQPSPNTNLTLVLAEPFNKDGTALRPVETVVTDAQGNFKFAPQLYLGGNYTITLPDARGTTGLDYIPINIQPGQTTDLGNIRKK